MSQYYQSEILIDDVDILNNNLFYRIPRRSTK